MLYQQNEYLSLKEQILSDIEDYKDSTLENLYKKYKEKLIPYLDDEDVILAAVKKHSYLEFQYASKDLKNNSDFIIKLITEAKSPLVLCFAEEKPIEHEWVIFNALNYANEAEKEEILNHIYISQNIKDKILKSGIKNWMKYMQLKEQILDNIKYKKVTLNYLYVIHNKKLIRYLDDVDVMLLAVKEHSYSVFQYASDRLKNDWRAVIKIIRQTKEPLILFYTGKKIIDNKFLVFAALDTATSFERDLILDIIDVEIIKIINDTGGIKSWLAAYRNYFEHKIKIINYSEIDKFDNNKEINLPNEKHEETIKRLKLN